MKRRRVVWKVLAVLTALLALVADPGIVVGNGGTVRVAERLAGPYVVSVFTDPSPMTVGLVDVSVLVRRPNGLLVDGAAVSVTAAQPGSDAASVVMQPATRDAATNKLYYAANLRLGGPGLWIFAVRVIGPEGEGQVEFEAAVEPANALSQPMILVLLLVVPALAGMWWVGNRSRRIRSNN